MAVGRAALVGALVAGLACHHGTEPKTGTLRFWAGATCAENTVRIFVDGHDRGLFKLWPDIEITEFVLPVGRHSFKVDGFSLYWEDQAAVQADVKTTLLLECA